jgi:hypothetical protein
LVIAVEKKKVRQPGYCTRPPDFFKNKTTGSLGICVK